LSSSGAVFFNRLVSAPVVVELIAEKWFYLHTSITNSKTLEIQSKQARPAVVAWTKLLSSLTHFGDGGLKPCYDRILVHNA